MPADLAAAERFLVLHARQLDRRRFAVRVRGEDPAALLAALDGYRNPDGGYGWGLEPDLRDRTSQPGGALHALEAFADAAPATSPHAAALCDWLAANAVGAGALPFALPVTDPAGTAWFWSEADPAVPSLHITAALAAAAHRVARHDEAVAAHPWLGQATRFCLETLSTRPPAHAYELSYALAFLDAVHETRPEAPALLERLARRIPADARLPVEGGLDDEALRALDLAPHPGRPVRGALDPAAVAADLERVEHAQEPDGGWTVDFASASPAAALEWRGYATVQAVLVLLANDRLRA